MFKIVNEKGEFLTAIINRAYFSHREDKALMFNFRNAMFLTRLYGGKAVKVA